MFNSNSPKFRVVSLFSTLLICALLLSANALTGYAIGCAKPQFKAARSFLIGQVPIGVAVADFNSDGKLDIATANSGAVDPTQNTIAVLYGDGTGEFGGLANTILGRKPYALALANINNDGRPDLVTANFDTNDVSVLLNNGAGSFTVGHHATGFGPRSVVVGDFNNDGNQDIVTANRSASNIALLLGNGVGGFNAPLLTNVGQFPSDVAAADFNLDGKLDLAVANAGTGAPGTGSVSILLNNGAGGFTPSPNIPVGSSEIIVGDFNNDTKPDVVVPGRAYLGIGDGSFNPAGTVDGGLSFQTTDFNSDGNLDVVGIVPSSSFTPNQFRVSLGNGSGGFAPAQTYLTGQDARALAIGDVTGDGKLDVVVAAAAIHSAVVSEGNGAGDFDTPIVLPVDVGTQVVADFNADGNLDLAHTGSGFTNGVTVRYGNGNGQFPTSSFHSIPEGPSRLFSGDLNNDGKLDLVTGGGGGVSILLNNGNGVFTSHTTYSLGGTAFAVVIGDFNSDGKPDIAASPGNLPAIRILIGDGLGGFIVSGNVPLTAIVAVMRKADFNSDGITDLIIGKDNNTVAILNGNGAGGFGSEVDVPVTPNPYGITPAFVVRDVNRDGKPDLIVAYKSAYSSQVLLGNGANGFAPPIEFYAGANPATIVAGDFNNDRKDDVAIGSSGFGSNIIVEFTVVLGDGTGNFGQPRTYVGGSPTQVGDFNTDGSLDIVVAGSTAMIVLNECRVSRGGVTSDFDGDGITDLSVFRPANGFWYILNSSDNSFRAVQFGTSGDIAVPGDYDVDGKTDIAVWRPSNGTWYYLRSSDSAFAFQQFGANGDVPVQGDYDGDGRTNFAVWRQSTGTWYTSLDPVTNFGAQPWGFSTDIPTPADYDGDGRTDIAVYRPSNSTWYLLQSTLGYKDQQFGSPGDTPVPADYDGDGKANFGVFRPTTGFWYTSLNPATNFGAVQLGQSGDIPVPGYYDGDARADVAVFRNGDWFIRQSTNGALKSVHFGDSGDVPIPVVP